MKLKYFFITLSVLLLFSCDLLRFSRFEVVSWTPGNGIFSDPDSIVISLKFSNDPNKANIERNFSLTGNGNRVKGIFRWEGKKIIFVPLAPLEINTDYIINLSADACDSGGLSMDEAFIRSFSTRSDSSRPLLISCFPSMYAEVGDRRSEVRLEFSFPVTLKTLYSNVSFNPSMTGLWRLEDNEKLAIFTPSEPWRQNIRYEIRISAELAGVNGMNIGKEILSVFITQTDYEAPFLLCANRITNKGEVIILNADKGYSSAALSPVENSDWEKDDKLQLIFSEAVDSVSLKNYLNVENGSSLYMETPPGFHTEFLFKFENIPAYESRFTFKLKPGVKDSAGNESKDEYIYRIFANGKYSKPPALVGLRMPMSPKNEIDKKLEYFSVNSLHELISISDDNYPSGESVSTWIELYFITAEDALIDPFSVMEYFRIDTTNNVISFSPRQVKISNFTISDPHPGMENYQRIEISGNLINTTNYGIIYFQISPGLRDNFGNKNEKLLKISVIK